jgi:hypothetical protein
MLRRRARAASLSSCEALESGRLWEDGPGGRGEGGGEERRRASIVASMCQRFSRSKRPAEQDMGMEGDRWVWKEIDGYGGRSTNRSVRSWPLHF